MGLLTLYVAREMLYSLLGIRYTRCYGNLVNHNRGHGISDTRPKLFGLNGSGVNGCVGPSPVHSPHGA